MHGKHTVLNDALYANAGAIPSPPSPPLPPPNPPSPSPPPPSPPTPPFPPSPSPPPPSPPSPSPPPGTPPAGKLPNLHVLCKIVCKIHAGLICTALISWLRYIQLQYVAHTSEFDSCRSMHSLYVVMQHPRRLCPLALCHPCPHSFVVRETLLLLLLCTTWQIIQRSKPIR